MRCFCMISPFLVVIRPDCSARAVGYHRAGLRKSRVKPEAACGPERSEDRTGEDFRKKTRITVFFRPLNSACPVVFVGVLGRCNRLGRFTAKKGAKAARIPQTTRAAGPTLCRVAACFHLLLSKRSAQAQAGRRAAKPVRRTGAKRTPGSTRPVGCAMGRLMGREGLGLS